MDFIRAVLRDRRGGTAIEYGLVAALIAVAAIVAFQNVGTQADLNLDNVGAAMNVT